jgi:hypothetical protein
LLEFCPPCMGDIFKYCVISTTKMLDMFLGIFIKKSMIYSIIYNIEILDCNFFSYSSILILTHSLNKGKNLINVIVKMCANMGKQSLVH